jgi:hypothetical protein
MKQLPSVAVVDQLPGVGFAGCYRERSVLAGRRHGPTGIMILPKME